MDKEVALKSPIDNQKNCAVELEKEGTDFCIDMAKKKANNKNTTPPFAWKNRRMKPLIICLFLFILIANLPWISDFMKLCMHIKQMSFYGNWGT